MSRSQTNRGQSCRINDRKRARSCKRRPCILVSCITVLVYTISHTSYHANYVSFCSGSEAVSAVAGRITLTRSRYRSPCYMFGFKTILFFQCLVRLPFAYPCSILCQLHLYVRIHPILCSYPGLLRPFNNAVSSILCSLSIVFALQRKHCLRPRSGSCPGLTRRDKSSRTMHLHPHRASRYANSSTIIS